MHCCSQRSKSTVYLTVTQEEWHKSSVSISKSSVQAASPFKTNRRVRHSDHGHNVLRRSTWVTVTQITELIEDDGGREASASRRVVVGECLEGDVSEAVPRRAVGGRKINHVLYVEVSSADAINRVRLTGPTAKPVCDVVR